MTSFLKKYKRFALALSCFALIVWLFLGAGTSLAWFTDTDEELNNIFHFAEFDLDVSYRRPGDPNWKPLEAATEVFDKEALYEPGYTQVIYLRVDNLGNVPFDFSTAVSVTDYTVATNIFGNRFHLQDYLRFGLTVADTEAAMEETVSTREKADEIANDKLSNYATQAAPLAANSTKYIALVVRMPKEVNNHANYRGDKIPRVELGIIVRATQQNEP